MKPMGFRFFLSRIILPAAVLLWASIPAHGAILYKSYVVKMDRGRAVLCDPYIVGEKDAVLSVLRQKGELAADNFTEFLHLFKRLNPHIRDLNRIEPGQHLFIPIRKLPPGEFSRQPEARVTIPFVTISKIKKRIRAHSDTHHIQRGECVSVLVARRFGAFGTDAYRMGVDLFRHANPGISDINRVFAGQKVYLPRPSIQQEPWFTALLDPSGSGTEAETFTTLNAEVAPATPGDSMTAGKKDPPTPFSRAAELIDATLIRKGRYFFPAPNGADRELDLTRFPILEMKDGKRVILCEEKLDDTLVRAIRSYWPDARTLVLSKDAPLETVLDALSRVIPGIFPGETFRFSDNGLEVALFPRWMIHRPGAGKHPLRKTAVFLAGGKAAGLPDVLTRYFAKYNLHVEHIDPDLKYGLESFTETETSPPKTEPVPPVIRIHRDTPRRVIPKILSALGYLYTPDVSVFFPYGGVQVKAWTDMVTLPTGKMLLVDFGDLQGDAVHALTTAGIPVFQFTGDIDKKDRLVALLNTLQCRFRTHPTFSVGNHREKADAALTFPGVLVSTKDEKSTLITHDGIDGDALAFLQEKGIQVVTVPEAAGWM